MQKIAACFVVIFLSAAVHSSAHRLSDEQLFQRLDTSWPGLEAFSNAVARADLKAATAELASYMRKRDATPWGVDTKAARRDDKRRRERGDAILRFEVSSIGIPWKFKDRIDWTFNPTTAPDSKWPANREWTWQLNRHTIWQELAHTYQASGDERYAAGLAAQMRDWIERCPVPLAQRDNGPISRWRTIEAGIRTGSVWPEIWPRIIQSPSIDDGTIVQMLKSWVDHADYLMKFHAAGNWLTMEANGLYHVGALFPEFRDAAAWRETAMTRLHRELDIQVYPDGAQIELAPGYHGVSLRNFLGPVYLAQRTSFSLPPDYTAKLERMYDYYIQSMQPHRRTPPLNDSGAHDVTSVLREGATLFPARKDFLWFGTQGKEGVAPAAASTMLPYAGQCFLRESWDRNARWMGFEAGPFGFGHQHEDKLGILLTAFGQSLLVEGGVYTYDASPWRRYVLSSRAHNVVMVDGMDQNRAKSPRESWVVKTPLPIVWQTNSTHDLASGVFEEGWGAKAERIVRHRRDVLYVKPDFFAVVDHLESLDGKPHTYEALFHLDASNATVNGTTVSTEGSGPQLSIRSFGVDEASIVKGQTNPVVQGWLPDSSLGYGGIRPIPTAIFKKTGGGKVTMIHILNPSPGPASHPVSSATVADGKLILSLENGAEKSFPLP